MNTPIHWTQRSHLSQEPISKIWDVDQSVLQSFLPDIKPHGFWYQVDHEWEEWCSCNMPAWVKPNRCSIEVDHSRMIVIDSFEKLKAFSLKYKYKTITTRQLTSEFRTIDWSRVAADYAGIEISPYQHEARYAYMWYYSWDVASGCVWDSSAIRIIKNASRII
jgi:hypothetical protein